MDCGCLISTRSPVASIQTIKLSALLTTGESIESRTIIGNFASYITPLLADIRFIQTWRQFCCEYEPSGMLCQRQFVSYGGKIIPISANRNIHCQRFFMDYLMTRQVPK